MPSVSISVRPSTVSEPSGSTPPTRPPKIAAPITCRLSIAPPLVASMVLNVISAPLVLSVVRSPHRTMGP